MAHNEALFLPIWTAYYANQVGAENLFIIDHGSDDGSTDALPYGVNLTTLPRPAAGFDEYDRTAIVSHMVRLLLIAYEVVIFGDSDELIIGDPDQWSGLAAFCTSAPDIVSPVGLNVFQNTRLEPAFDRKRPIFAQRRFCQFKSDFCKPVVLKRPVTWAPGFHACDAPAHQAADLFLFHMKSIDTGESLARLARTRSMHWAASTLRDGLGHHQRADDDFHLQDSFAGPLLALAAAPDAAFDFTADLARRAAGMTLANGFYTHAAFAGAVATIPARFAGLC